MNCILLYEFSLFYTILAFSTIFLTFSLKNQQFQKMLWSHYNLHSWSQMIHSYLVASAGKKTLRGHKLIERGF